MNKFLVFILVLATIFLGFYLLLKRNVSIPTTLDQISDVVRNASQERTPEGETVDYLKVKDGSAVYVYADLSGGKPRVLEFDPKGRLFATIPNQGRVVALPDEDGNGVADRVIEVVGGLTNPHGLVFLDRKLYISEADGVTVYDYDVDNISVSNPTKIITLSDTGRHTTRTIKERGGKLFISVGSSCDSCIEVSKYRGTILSSNLNGGDLQVFAKGLRNTVFFEFDEKGNIWGGDMGRDFLGDDLPSEEVNIIKDGGDYGWPYCYGMGIRDTEFMEGKEVDYCSSTINPIFEMPAHTAPLGITFDGSGNILLSQHGSWNSTTPVGYKVVKLTRKADIILKMEDYITGFIDGDNVIGRPAGLTFGGNGDLYLADDHAGLIYLVK